MRFTLSAFADEAGGSIAEQIAAMKENGIACLEIRGVDGENISDMTTKKAREIRSRLDDAGIAVWSLGSPYGKIGIGEKFEPHLDRFKHGLELADIFGTKHIRLFSFYLPSGEAGRYFDEVMARLEKFQEAAKGTGVVLCHENEKGIFGDTAARCAQIHREFPAIRAVFDPANFIQCKEDTLAAWKLLAPYVEYLHIKDALSDGRVVLAGKGIGNLPYLLEQYAGEVVTIEPHLTVFDGLEKLESGQENHVGRYCYPSQRAAFDAAVDALKALLA